jgi:hypothetical protein
MPTLRAAAGARIGGGLGFAAAGTAVQIRNLGAAVASAVPVWGVAAAAALTLVVAHKRAADAAREFEEAAERTAQSQLQIAQSAERRIRQAGIDPDSPEAEVIRLTASIEGLREDINTRQSGRPGLGDTGIQFGAIGILANLPDLIRRRLDTESVEGSSEELAEVISRQLQDLVNASIDQARQNLETEGKITSTDQVRRIADLLGLRFEAIQDDPLAAADRFFQNQLDQAAIRNAVAEYDSDSPEETQRRRDAALALSQETLALQQEFFDILLETDEQLVASLAQFDRDLDRLDNQVFLGIKTRGEAEQFLVQYAAAAQSLAEQLAARGDADQAQVDEAYGKAEAAWVRLIRFQIEGIEDSARSLSRGSGEIQRIKGEIAATRNLISELRSRGLPVPQDELDKLGDLYESFYSTLRNQQIARAEGAISIARTFSTRDAAVGRLIRVLEQQARALQAAGDTYGAEVLRLRATQLKIQREQDNLENAIEAETARILLSAPALSTEAALIAQISAVKTRIAAERDSTKSATLTQELRELQAQLLQEELARLTALTNLQVSVRDSIGEYTVALSALRREVEIAAEVYGSSSREWAEASRAVQNAEAQLLDALIELDSVNRQLGPDFDVTDPLDAAIENYIRIAQKLQIPDLGEAERAALELELKNAEAARIQAEFNNQLFQLKFQFERGDIGLQAYLSSLRGLLDQVDTSTQAGKELWLQINALIEGLTNDISSQAFNIPGQIRLPTLFEVRRAVQAEAMGVNYLDNRQQNINVYVSSNVEMQAVADAMANAFDVEESRFAPGGAGITIGGF